MADALNEYETVELARNADIVLNNPAFSEAIARMKADSVAALLACPIRDREGQLLLLQAARITDKFEVVLTAMVQGGKLAQHKIDIEQERNESRTQRFLRKVA